MASIKLNDLRPVGFALFDDSESFLNNLKDEELGTVEGGLSIPTTTFTTSITLCYPSITLPWSFSFVAG